MRANQITEIGDADKPTCPACRPAGQVQVKVAVARVNNIDILLRAGATSVQRELNADPGRHDD